MKKTLTLIGMAAVLLAASSCNKSEKEIVESVKVAISVSSLTPDTKAVKADWTSGDILNVYLDDATAIQPDFTLTFDGSTWNASDLDASVTARLQASGGHLRGFWEGSNSCMSDDAWTKATQSVQFPNFANFSSTGVTGHIVAVFNSIPYTYSQGTLTASINSWSFGTDLQIVVSGLSYSPGRYTLYSDEIQNPRVINMHVSDPQVGVLHWGEGSSIGRIAGIENEDGVAFVGHIKGNSKKDYVFSLLDNNTGTVYTFKKESLSLDSSGGTKLVAIKIPFTKFYVDLGLPSGLKWAVCNLGAAKPEDFGDYYAWGETEPYYLPGHAYDDPCSNWKDGKTSGYNWSSYKFKDDWIWLRYTGSDYDTLLPEDDAASYDWGSGWRMPTHGDWSELVSSTDKSWVWASTDGYSSSGYLLTSTVPGFEHNSIFLPAAGYRGDRYLGGVEDNTNPTGSYWSSSLSDSNVERAMAPGFDHDNFSLNNVNKRHIGCQIRPVKAD